MLQSLFACVMLLIACTLLHYEVLRTLNNRLPSMRVPDRLKVVVVILGAFAAHLLEMLLYGATFYALVTWWGAGQLTGLAGSSWTTCLYFSAETYTSLGFGDLTPVGPVRMLVGTEALAGLLMIAWSASFTYLSMERFWRTEKG
ncbi:potassium channel family protein [Hydrogenophaga sp. PAMC20947]|uniref:potassium channel family protein n=1 Tax=Hydrogenophaga sp. PAMC20947 TaxID=2565558 RepID=UPI00109D8215|nr:potassium channel family protein [Hydrogenophaga sp. PAMC20947]QCB44915.1 two pore domain potassium channel family protein [Hydrogenophaga sp. PAMC20947]